MKIALVQFNSRWEDVEHNLFRARQFVEIASKDACDVVVFPEMFPTGLTLDSDYMTRVSITDIKDTLADYARTYTTAIIAGHHQPYGEKIGNVAAVYDKQGKLAATYLKNHLLPISQEHVVFTAGKEISTFTIDTISAAVSICYDLRFPELLRAIAKQVKIIFVIANWPSSRIEQWDILLQARAIENQCFVVGVNRIGTDGNNLHYPGGSTVFGPWGERLIKMDDRAEYAAVDISIDRVEEVRSRYPFLNSIKR